MSFKNVLEDNVKNFLGAACEHLSKWLQDEKNVEVTSEELCIVFDLPYKPLGTPTSGLPNGASIQTQMPNLPNYFSGVTTPKKRGGRTKKALDPNLPQCAYKMLRGKNPGQQCPKQVLGDGSLGADTYCKDCLKKAAVKSVLEGTSAKPTVQPPSMPNSTVDIPEQVEKKDNELQVTDIGDGFYQEVTHGFIVKPEDDGSVTALYIDDKGSRRELKEDERKIAKGMGMNVVEPKPVPLPSAPNTSNSLPQIPQISTLQLPK